MMTTTTTMTTTTERSVERQPGRGLGLGTRLIIWYLVLLALASAVSIFALRQVLLANARERTDTSLAQEIEEFRRVIDDPEIAAAAADDLRIAFDTYLATNVPDRDEAVLTVIGGDPYKSSFEPPTRLDEVPNLVESWSNLVEPEWATVTTPQGSTRYVAMPVLQGDETIGVFSSGFLVAPAEAEVADAIRLAALVSGGVLLVASAAAWLVAWRLLAPVRELTETTERIEAVDLTGRLDIEGNDEVARLARSFNAMLDRLDDAFSSQRAFLDDAAHELRTPITIVRGHLELMGDDPVERRETVALVTDELDRMARMVDDLLLLAKSRRPDFLRLEMVEPGELIDEVSEKTQVLGDRRWSTELGANVRIVADSQRLTQALVNLVDNAVRHTVDGDEITLGSTVDGSVIRLWVRDTGTGIAEAQRNEIFERHRQGNGAEPVGSAGLGLAIARAVAEAHGGRVELDSQVGVGSTFALVLPIDQPSDTIRS
jgi:two-component system, OmpR family, sensor kinase